METRTPLSMLTPSQQNAENSTLDFCKLTPLQFGINANSFITFPKDKDKSRVAQLKARRRSTIGIRGSPEANSLICFRAKKAMKTPPCTPQHLLESPLFSGCDSIKQKMAAFQRLMETDEENTEGCVSLMKEEVVEGVARTCSDGGGETESRLSPLSPPLSKRRRRGKPHQRLCQEMIEEEEKTLSELTNTPKPKPQVECKSPRTSPGLGSDSQSKLISLPMLSKPELILTDDDDVFSISKKKRVRFGAALSPEFFDKTLPPSTPLQKGATPANPASSAGRSRSLLKMPQRFEPPLPQPDFSSPGGDGASPVLRAHTYTDRGAHSDEVFVEIQKISFPMDEEYDNQPAESKDPPETLELTAHHKVPEAALLPAHEESLHCLTTTPDHDPSIPTTAEPELTTEQEHQHQTLKTAESSAEAPRSRGRKRKIDHIANVQPPAKNKMMEPRRSLRSAAESAKGKMKSSMCKRFGIKDVDRSLYGKRDYASKNPLLSPIMESAMPSLSGTPTLQRTDDGPDSSPATAHPNPSNVAAFDHDATADLVAAAAQWRCRFLCQTKDSETDNQTNVKSHTCVASLPVSADRQVSTDRGGRNTLRRRSGKAVEENEAIEIRISGPHKANQKEKPVGELFMSENLSTGRKPKTQRGGKTRGRKSSRKKNSSEEEKTCRDQAESSGHQEDDVIDTRQIAGLVVVEKKDKDVKQTLGNYVEEKSDKNVSHISGCDVQEKNDKDVSCVVEEKNKVWNPSSENLESWQQPDFFIEDILKPVTKSRGSVRRSLRHRRSMDVLATGLAWVEHTSPEGIATNQRRMTRGRLNAVSQPPTAPGSEETPGNQ